MSIQDSGERRIFVAGAVRDMQSGKGRCDLMPIEELALCCDDHMICLFAEFVRNGSVSSLINIVKEFCHEHWGSIWTGMLEVSKHYEEGAEKYGEHNWEKGIPAHSYIDSALRHYFKYKRGDDDEPHDRAFVWNILGLMWTIRNKEEQWNDVFYAKFW